MDFGRLLGPFWELKCHQKINEILDANFEAKRGQQTPDLGSARRNARGRGEDNGGVQGCQNCRSDEDQAFGTLGSDLARRPRWGGGSLRAFRRAEAARMCNIPRCVFRAYLRVW